MDRVEPADVALVGQPVKRYVGEEALLGDEVGLLLLDRVQDGRVEALVLVNGLGHGVLELDPGQADADGGQGLPGVVRALLAVGTVLDARDRLLVLLLGRPRIVERHDVLDAARGGSAPAPGR